MYIAGANNIASLISKPPLLIKAATANGPTPAVKFLTAKCAATVADGFSGSSSLVITAVGDRKNSESMNPKNKYTIESWYELDSNDSASKGAHNIVPPATMILR
jgi:hypothetical protein